jgi:hypothetical protein
MEHPEECAQPPAGVAERGEDRVVATREEQAEEGMEDAADRAGASAIAAEGSAQEE